MIEQQNNPAIAVGLLGVVLLVLICLISALWDSAAFYRPHNVQSFVEQVSQEQLGID